MPLQQQHARPPSIPLLKDLRCEQNQLFRQRSHEFRHRGSAPWKVVRFSRHRDQHRSPANRKQILQQSQLRFVNLQPAHVQECRCQSRRNPTLGSRGQSYADRSTSWRDRRNRLTPTAAMPQLRPAMMKDSRYEPVASRSAPAPHAATAAPV